MTLKDRASHIARTAVRFLRAWSWHLSVIALLAWIGFELRELNQSMPDYTWELDQLSSDVQSIRQRLDEIRRDRVFR